MWANGVSSLETWQENWQMKGQLNNKVVRFKQYLKGPDADGLAVAVVCDEEEVTRMEIRPCLPW